MPRDDTFDSSVERSAHCQSDKIVSIFLLCFILQFKNSQIIQCKTFRKGHFNVEDSTRMLSMISFAMPWKSKSALSNFLDRQTHILTLFLTTGKFWSPSALARRTSSFLVGSMASEGEKLV